MNIPALIITIDTEGDNLWENHQEINTKNARYLSRFQLLCEKFHFKPVWLTNYEMAKDPIFIEFAQDVINRKKGEIGMHLHAWNSPPKYQLLKNNNYHQHFNLIEYPNEIMREKILYMTRLLEETFNTKILSHRAGRWSFDSRYARFLIELGYQVDCSVTPYVNWKNIKGIIQEDNGSDYRYFPNKAYFIDVNDISKPGSSSLLEVPMSIHYKYPLWINFLKKSYDHFRGKYYSPSVNWFRPAKKNIKNMIAIAKKCISQGNDYIEFMLHSSELMPGGSPTFKDEIAIEKLYCDLEQLFEWLKKRTKGITLSEFYQQKITCLN